MLKSGTILDERYEIIDVVGTGGMSTVYRAQDTRLKRYVAIKVLKTEYSNDQNFVSRFRVEAQASAGLTHPNIVSVYDVCEDNGRNFIVMELVEGITLKEYINLNGRLSMDQAIDFSIQIASGLEAAHQHHVIHRDIKPQNIIVSKTGTLKITDFGIAKAATSNTLSTSGMGSVHYISPEQARGGYSDERSDIYSLGITMYEMVTGKVPFEGDTNVAIALMHIQTDIVPPREYYPDIYSSMEKVILKATQKKPERRYFTAAALIADLNRVKNNPNIDIIVATNVPSGPTQRFTNKDIEAIKSEAQGQKEEAPSSRPTPDKTKLNALLEDEDDFDDEEEERPKKKQSIKKVSDDEDDFEYERSSSKERDEEDIDPKLEKAVVIGGVAVAVIIAIIIFVIIGNILGWFHFGSKNKATTATSEATTEKALYDMQDVVGMTQLAAEKILRDAGFSNITFVNEKNEDVKEGYVIRSNPEKGSKIAKDEAITVYVSAGAEEVTVPTVVGKGYSDDQATKILEEQGFKVTHSFEFDDEIEKDKIVSQEPEGGSKAAKGSEVKIVVSNGSEVKKVEVPVVTGISESAASSSLKASKLSVGNVTYEHSDSVEKGLVISQSVGSGNQVNEGTSVDLVISDGPAAKTYTGVISGSIKNNNVAAYTGKNVTVTVYIIDGDGVHTAAATTASGESQTIPIDGSVSGLSFNNGRVQVEAKDSEGNDVSGDFSQSLTLTFSED
ncbi:MAG: Stk1 family PASTA domain-containing Ser/Thr kinase [Eubacterium sp.]|nr:Stk1 family PASTA domain-containing Ser/Thr kinase [Eubacterium sp.]